MGKKRLDGRGRSEGEGRGGERERTGRGDKNVLPRDNKQAVAASARPS